MQTFGVHICLLLKNENKISFSNFLFSLFFRFLSHREFDPDVLFFFISTRESSIGIDISFSVQLSRVFYAYIHRSSLQPLCSVELSWAHSRWICISSFLARADRYGFFRLRVYFSACRRRPPTSSFLFWRCRFRREWYLCFRGGEFPAVRPLLLLPVHFAVHPHADQARCVANF